MQAPSGNADKADATTLRALLSLKALELKLIAEGEGGFSGSIIAELRDIDNQLLIQTVGGKDVLTVVSHDIIGRIMIKSARNPGLADVYEGLLGFEGAEFYMACHDKDCPEIVGMTFGDLGECFDNAIPFGVHRVHVAKNADIHRAQRDVFEHLLQEDGGAEMLSVKPNCDYFINPPGSLKIHEGDEIIVLAQDDDTYSCSRERCRQAKARLCGRGSSAALMPGHMEPDDARKELILMCGWRRDIDDIIRLLNELTGPGSELHILSELPMDERVASLQSGGLDVTDPEVAFKANTDKERAEDEEWGDDPRDNYILLLNGEPNLRLVQHEGNPANSRDIRVLNQQLAEYWAAGEEAQEGGKAGAVGAEGGAVQKSVSSESMRRSSDSWTSAIGSESRFESLKEFDSVLILADAKRETDPMHSDSNVLATLLLLKEEQRKQGVRRRLSILHDEELHSTTSKHSLSPPAGVEYGRRQTEGTLKTKPKACTITFEIVDPRTQQILRTNEAITAGSFYIISTHIVAKYLAMVAERKEIHGVLRELLGPTGAEISLVPISKFVREDRHMSFRDVQRKCRHLETICLGYVQHIINKKTGKFTVVRSGNVGIKNSTDGSSEPLPRDMDEKMIWSGEDDEFKVLTFLIVIKGRHHDMETLRHFGMEEEAKRYSYLTHDLAKRPGVRGSGNGHGEPLTRMPEGMESAMEGAGAKAAEGAGGGAKVGEGGVKFRQADLKKFQSWGAL